MNIDILIRECAEVIRGIPAIGDTPVFEEDKGDVSRAIETAVAQTLRCIVAGISRAYHDIIITPNGKKYLTTPKHAAAYAHTVPELKRRGWKIFRPGSKLCLLGYRRKGDEPVMLYALAEKAKQKKDPTLLPSQSYCSRIVGTAITNEVNRRLKNAS